MPLEAPNLDDRSFDQIVAEAKALIPRYAPEWTDHNDSDPGITLIQLFAWMTEMIIYRLNQVPERNYIKFLQLLGIELNPARPARTELTFVFSADAPDTIMVPKGTQVATAGRGEEEPLVFETDEGLFALKAELKGVQSFDGSVHSVETTKNVATGQWFHPFGPGAREKSALLLGFESPTEFSKEKVDLTVLVCTQDLKAEGFHCNLDLANLPLPATLIWEFYDGQNWRPLDLDKDETRAFTRSGHVRFRGPGERIKKSRLGRIEEELYWIRCCFDRGAYEMSPRLDMVLTNTVRATQAVTARDEVLGGSDGSKDQTFQLSNSPVVQRDELEEVTGAGGVQVRLTSLRLEVDEGRGFEVWQEVDDFYAVEADDPCYVLNRTTGEIKFGDGQRGRIPLASPDNPNSNIVAREYRYGGGKRGNVGAETITELQTYVAAVESVSNKRAAIGGSDEETMENAKMRAPRELKTRHRAVTTEDFESLAVGTPGVRVRRAKALPLFHPKFRDTQIPGTITVIVVPESDAPNPIPSEATLTIVCEHLNKHRLVTTEVYVIPPTYHEVSIEADIVARPDADLGNVKRGVQERLRRFFHPLEGGQDGGGWEFGRDIFYSEVYREILHTPGVDRVENSELYIWLNGERQPFCRDVPINPGELLYSEEHLIRVAYSTRV